MSVIYETVFYRYVWFFVIYAFIGWCMEVAYAAVKTGKLVNRGFLNGPVCPIYGFGMVGILGILLHFISGDNLVPLFFGGMLLTTAIELFGGWILDVLFHMRWWDYRMYRLNFKGYICLRFSLLWGLGVVLIVRLLHPLIERLAGILSTDLGVVLLAVILAVFLADLLVTLQTVIGMTQKVGELERIASRLHALSDELTQLVGSAALDTSERLEEGKQNLEQLKESGQAVLGEKRRELEERIAELENSGRELAKKLHGGVVFGSGRLLQAFPSLRRSRSGEYLTGELQRFRDGLHREKDKQTETEE